MVPLVLLGCVPCKEDVFASGAVAGFAWEDKADTVGCHQEPGKAVS